MATVEEIKDAFIATKVYKNNRSVGMRRTHGLSRALKCIMAVCGDEDIKVDWICKCTFDKAIICIVPFKTTHFSPIDHSLSPSLCGIWHSGKSITFEG